MVHRKVVMYSLTLFVALGTCLILSGVSNACSLGLPTTFYSNCNNGMECNSDYDCVSDPQSGLYDWGWDLGRCQIGYYAGNFYPSSGICIPETGLQTKYCACSVIVFNSLRRWTLNPSYEGQTCEVKCGTIICQTSDEGRYDDEGGKCIRCSNYGSEYWIIDPTDGGYDVGDGACDAACPNVASKCDEIVPGASISDSCAPANNPDKLYLGRTCDSNCQVQSANTYTCDSSQCGIIRRCGGLDYMCAYDIVQGGWYWTTQASKTFCCNDQNCKDNGIYCSGTLSNRYAGCKITDDYGNPVYTCTKCDPCVTGSDCGPGNCCDIQAGQPTGNCVGKGTIYNSGGKSYLCDPPEWESDGKVVIDWLKPVMNFIVLQSTL